MSRHSRRIVDLTLTVAEELPAAWSTHMPYQQKTFNYFTDVASQTAPLRRHTGVYQTRWLAIDEHTGTHVDAPAHFIPEPGTGLPHAGPAGDITVEQIPLEQLQGEAVVIDVPEKPAAAPGESPLITAEDVERFEREHGRIEPGSIVLFRSGWDRNYVTGEEGKDYCFNPLVLKNRPGWPAPDESAMQVLLDRGVTCVGTDGTSMGSTHDGSGVHQLALAKNVVFIEALANLAELPVRGAFFVFAPIKIARGTGAPGRAFAWIDDKNSTENEGQSA